MEITLHKYAQEFVTLVNKGLYHPNFLGRVISWGVLVGSIGFVAHRIYVYAKPKILESYKSRFEIPKPEKENIEPKVKKPTDQKPPQSDSPEPVIKIVQVEKIVEVVKQIICKKCKDSIYPSNVNQVKRALKKSHVKLNINSEIHSEKQPEIHKANSPKANVSASEELILQKDKDEEVEQIDVLNEHAKEPQETHSPESDSSIQNIEITSSIQQDEEGPSNSESSSEGSKKKSNFWPFT